MTARSLVRSCYWSIRRKIEPTSIGAYLTQLHWRTRHLRQRAFTLPQIAAKHPHRPQVIDAVMACRPFESCLEVGSGTGANLVVLAERASECSFYGVDINPHVVDIGTRAFQEHDIRNVQLLEGRADDLSQFADSSVDVVLTDAVLMFVGPTHIHAAISELVRVARKNIVLNEYVSERPPADNYDGGRFVYDFATLFRSARPGVEVRCVPSAFAETGGAAWERYGQLVQVRL